MRRTGWRNRWRPQCTRLSHRSYLADAVFTACLTGAPETLRACEQALLAPQWPPYLGRRSCHRRSPPDRPAPRPLHHLVHLPLARPRHDPATYGSTSTPTPPRPPAAPLIHQQYADREGTVAVRKVNDDPQEARIFRPAPSTNAPCPGADQCAGLGTACLTALSAYLEAA